MRANPDAMIRCKRYFILASVLLLAACEPRGVASPSDPVADRKEDITWRANGLAPDQLIPSADGRRLERADGTPIFLLGDSAWALVWKLGRSDIADYLSHRKAHGFNAIAVRAFCSRHTWPNAYEDPAFPTIDGEFDFTAPVVTPGNDPASSKEYDYWDHLDYLVDRAAAMGQYVLLSPVHGRFISGSWNALDKEGILLDASGAYELGHWFGARYGDRQNVVWVIGGDRNAILVNGDSYLTEYRALAEGIADGANGITDYDGTADWSTTTMTYWPRKYQPNSSYWFHQDSWLDFNSVQEITSDAVRSVVFDRSLMPHKPTFLFEGRYEAYDERYGPWQARLQAWLSVFSGGFGHLYGHESTYFFGFDWHRQVGDGAVWRESIQAPGALQMKHLRTVIERPGGPFSPLMLTEDDTKLDETWTFSNRVSALIGASRDRVFVYSANGRSFPLNLSRLTVPQVEVSWFSPRSGNWYVDGTEFATPTVAAQFSSGPGGGTILFDPPGEPGEGNDWVLLVEPAGSTSN